MVNLYFVRHGKTEWNLQSRYQGAGGDSPLLAESYVEMAQLAKSLAAVKFEHAYASPIKRARITAQTIIDQLDQTIPLSLLSRLEEFDLGQMEGMLFSEVAEKFPAEFDNFRNHPEQYDPHRTIGGESFPELIARMTPAINQIVTAASPDANVLIVSHGAALNAEINYLLNVPLADLRKRGGLANTSTTVLKAENPDHFELVKWNDTSYLKRKLTDSDTI